MIGIQTKYLCPTNSRGARIKAFTANGHSVTIPFPYEHGSTSAHFEAVKALVKKYNLDWNLQNMRHGALKDGYVFCFENSIVYGV